MNHTVLPLASPRCSGSRTMPLSRLISLALLRMNLSGDSSFAALRSVSLDGPLLVADADADVVVMVAAVAVAAFAVNAVARPSGVAMARVSARRAGVRR